MPYRIKARNRIGEVVTRIDQNVDARDITDKALADQLAKSFAETRGHGGPWTGYTEYYEGTIAASVVKERIATTIPAGHVRVNLE
jgi:hypothetical protein